MIRQRATNFIRYRQDLPFRRSSRNLSSHVVRAAIRKGAPPSIAAVASGIEDTEGKNVYIRQIGCTRRVFLLDPYLSAEEMDGLAYRLEALSKNEHINSILMAYDRDSSDSTLPSTLLGRDNPILVDPGFPPFIDQTYHIASGYNPRDLLTKNEKGEQVVNRELVNNTLSALQKLSKAIQGDSKETKIPFISMVHGGLQNGGFVWLQGAYAIATPETCLQFTGPSMGLSAFDPVGLSYTLPRMGKEFNQPSKPYAPAMSVLLSILGYQAQGWDLVATGLATNYIDDNPNGLDIFEQELAELPPWNQQGLLKRPVMNYGYNPDDLPDINAPYRNVSVADAVQCFASTRANNSSVWSGSQEIYRTDKEVSLDPDCLYLEEMPPVHSDLVDIAAAFSEVLHPSKSLVEIRERLKEIASLTKNEENERGVEIAKELVRRLEAASPLALLATHRLLQMGADTDTGRASRDQCMQREAIVQRNLFLGSDFRKWAEYGKDIETFTAWKHSSLDQVTKDEVEALFNEHKEL